MSEIRADENAIAPGTPSSGKSILYPLTDGLWYSKDDAGTETHLSGLPVNAQTGTTYTVLATDRGKLVTHTNGSAIAVTLPQATGNFASGWYYFTQNRGAGTVTITPTTSTVDGAATLALTTNQGALITSDGTNYFTMRGIGGSATPGGSDTYVQFNDSSTLGGDAGLTYVKATDTLTAGNLTVTTNATVGGTLGVTGVATFTAVPVFSSGLGAISGTTITATGNIDFAGFDLTASDGSATFTSSQQSDSAKFVGTYSTDNAATRLMTIQTAVAATGTQTMFIRFTAAGGATLMGVIAANNNAVAYNTTSDERLKTFLGRSSYGLDTINRINVEDFYWNNDDQRRTQFGVSAQKLYDVYPLAVSKGGDIDTPWSVDYGKLTPPIIKAIQELTARVEKLETVH